MTIDEAFDKIQFRDLDLLACSGPAVLRLKLLEVTSMARKPNLPRDILQAAHLASVELRQLIEDRPCVSQADVAARNMVLGEAP